MTKQSPCSQNNQISTAAGLLQGNTAAKSGQDLQHEGRHQASALSCCAADSSLPAFEREPAVPQAFVPEQHPLAALWLSRAALSRFSLTALLHLASRVDQLLSASSFDQTTPSAALAEQAHRHQEQSGGASRQRFSAQGIFLDRLRAHLHVRALSCLALAAPATSSSTPTPAPREDCMSAAASAVVNDMGVICQPHRDVMSTVEAADCSVLGNPAQSVAEHDKRPSPPCGEHQSSTQAAGTTVAAAAESGLQQDADPSLQPHDAPLEEAPSAVSCHGWR